MRLRTFDSLLSFLLGSSWAFVIAGVYLTYTTFSFLGFFPAIFFTFIFLFVALFMVLLLETLLLYRRDLERKHKETELLEEIRDTMKQSGKVST